MISRESVDGGRPFDWGRTSSDYVQHRPGYPASFYELLRALGIGTPGQRILDIATGPGVVALPLAAGGASVTGVDIAEHQINAARALAERDGIAATFAVADAHDTRLPTHSFDVITASMCVHYFTPERFVDEVARLLVSGGRLVVASLIYLPRESWRGRMRACRGVGASMNDMTLAAFEDAHESLLDEIAPPTFTVPHLITVQIFEVRDT